MQIHANLRRRSEIVEEPCLVADIIELPENEYASLYQDLIKEREYLAKRVDMDAFVDGQRCCVLILGEGQEDGILVDTQGKCIAYLSSFIPNARTLVGSHIRQLADYVVSEGTEHTEDGRWANSYDELYHHFGAVVTDTNGNGRLLREELQRRDEINELIMTEDCIEVTYHLQYCENCQSDPTEVLSVIGCNIYDEHDTHETEASAPEYVRTEENSSLRPLTQQDVDIMYAKHLQWINGAGGEQADFSNCLLKDINLGNKKFEDAIFDGARIVNSSLYNSDISYASFKGTRFYNCDLSAVKAEGTVFADSLFHSCEVSTTAYVECNFSRATFSECSLGSSMHRCCIDGTSFGAKANGRPELVQCSDDEKSWAEDMHCSPTVSM